MTRQTEALKTYVAMKRTINEIELDTRKYVTKFKLNMNEFAVLEILYHKGTRTTQELKEGILVANSSTTYIVDKLCEKNLVKREFSPLDRRVIFVDLTEEGRKLIEDIFPLHAQQLTDNFERLNQDEIKQLRFLLKKMNGLTG